MNVKIDLNEIEYYFDTLWPILRSITGDGVRKTHDILSEIIPLNRIEVETGTKVFDWEVPKEWNVNESYVITPNGEKILDMKENNLHILNYSMPFKGKVDLEELQKHLYSIPGIPNAIPYVTSYYKQRWGFCISENQREKLQKGEYEVFIDSSLKDGSLTISDMILPGKSDEEILFSTYTCHPSLANNELSGPITTAFLYTLLEAIPERYYTYRFVFLPETIGSIAYLSLHGKHLKDKLKAGYVITCIGDNGPFTYKRSRSGNTLADRAIEHVFRISNNNKILDLDITYNEYIKTNFNSQVYRLITYFPDYGSDERQYCSPGFNLPVGSIMKTMYGKYKEYHTSLDDKKYISFESIKESIELLYNVCMTLEKNRVFKNELGYCEPQLGRRGLYPTVGGSKETNNYTSAMMWLLNMSDGDNDLLSISRRSRYSVEYLYEIAMKCIENGILTIN